MVGTVIWKENIQAHLKNEKLATYVPLNPRSMQELNGPFFAFKISARAAKAPKRKKLQQEVCLADHF